MREMRFKRKKTVKMQNKKFHHSSLWYNIIAISQGDGLLYVFHTVRGPEIDNGGLPAVRAKPLGQHQSLLYQEDLELWKWQMAGPLQR